MKIKLITVFLSCLLLLSFRELARACPPPPCPECYYWSGTECVCHEACCEDEDCGTGIEECLSCNLDSCTCEDDDSKCTGECHNGCSLGMCVDDDSKCDPCECCIEGDCIGPMCDNCHSGITDTVYECGHVEESTHCLSSYCIKNVLETAGCDFRGDFWPCNKRNCDAAPDGTLHGIEQTTYNLVDPCPTGGEPVVTHYWLTYYYGCGSECWGSNWAKACEIPTCDTSDPRDDPSYLGQKYKCGCP